MAVLKTKDIESSLIKKGFDKYDNDHHRYVFYYDGLRTSIQTKISHSENEIGDTLINAMSYQMHLSKSQFIDFTKCTITKEEYIDILLNKNIIAR